MKKFTIDGIDYLEKEVTKQSDTAGKIYLPASWIGKKVAVILLDCRHYEDKSYNFDESDSDTGWKCNNPGSEFYNMYFYPTDRDFWDDWHKKLQQCKGYISKRVAAILLEEK